MKQTTSRLSGFTIVELLIVIVVIAILAAISVVAYTGIQNRAHDTTVSADAASIAKKMEIAKIDLGHYPITYAQFPDLKISKSAYSTAASNVFYCVNRSTDQYALGLTSKGDKRYIVNSGTVSEVASAGATPTCTTVGLTWGASDSTKTTITGFFSTGPSWNASWSWTN